MLCCVLRVCVCAAALWRQKMTGSCLSPKRSESHLSSEMADLQSAIARPQFLPFMWAAA